MYHPANQVHSLSHRRIEYLFKPIHTKPHTCMIKQHLTWISTHNKVQHDILSKFSDKPYID